jgi:hypothetical protein
LQTHYTSIDIKIWFPARNKREEGTKLNNTRRGANSYPRDIKLRQKSCIYRDGGVQGKTKGCACAMQVQGRAQILTWGAITRLLLRGASCTAVCTTNTFHHSSWITNSGIDAPLREFLCKGGNKHAAPLTDWIGLAKWKKWSPPGLRTHTHSMCISWILHGICSHTFCNLLGWVYVYISLVSHRSKINMFHPSSAKTHTHAWCCSALLCG